MRTTALRRKSLPWWVAAPALVLALWLAASPGCDEHIADAPAPAKTPRTQLWLYPDSGLAVGVSKQRLHWWGEDPDGVVIGYLFGYATSNSARATIPNPDTIRYSWVTATDSLVYFPLDTLFRYYLVAVRAVDNTFTGDPDSIRIVRLQPSPYWDRDDDGVPDGDDQQLPSLAGAMDQKGASLVFPIRNTPPTIAFLPNPSDVSIPLRQPDTTFTAATFAFKGSDFDGDFTLTSYRIALNDTSDPSHWLVLPTRDTIVTLVVPRARGDAAGPEVVADVYSGSFLGRRLIGQLPGLRLDALNVFFAQARDAAGEYSTAIRMPSGTDHWFVRRPRGRLLLVTDYITFDAPLALSTYLAALASIPGGNYVTVDRLDISLGLSSSDKSLGKLGRLVPAYVDPALIHTFLLFDELLWYTDQFPTLSVAQLTLLLYMQNGGRVLFTTSFQTSIDPRGALRDFAPIDSISSVDLSPNRPPVPPAVAGDSRIPANFILYADSTDPARIYPQLAFNTSPSVHSVFMRPVYRRTDARYIYHLQADTRTPVRYFGGPNLAVVDGRKTIIFIGVPLHLLNNTSVGNPLGVGAFLEMVLETEFSPAQRVNRRMF